MKTIDLNADIGELEGDAARRLDKTILAVVTSCNIACGGHAGRPSIMTETVSLARLSGVRIGAHPSYPDRENFGRKSLQMRRDDLKASLLAQVKELKSIANGQGENIFHLKPHGALYNDATIDLSLSDLICEVVVETGIPFLVGPPCSRLGEAAKRKGLRFIAEGFADRLYQPDGQLTPRTMSGAVLHNEADVVTQAVNLAEKRCVIASNGAVIELDVDTICLHGDTDGAADLAVAIRDAIQSRKIAVSAVTM